MDDPQIPSRRVTLDTGISLRVIERGEGEPRWLLVHGLASNARLWDGVATRLASAGAATVAVDQRGHGLSDRPDEGFDMATVADDLARLVTALGWERVVLAGQSWGGNVVLEALARHPDRFLGAVCIDGGFIRLRDRFDDWESCAEALAPPHLIGTPVEEMRGWVDRSAHDWPEEGRLGTMANFEVRADGTIAPWLTRERHMAILEGMWNHDTVAAISGVEEGGCGYMGDANKSVANSTPSKSFNFILKYNCIAGFKSGNSTKIDFLFSSNCTERTATGSCPRLSG